MLLNILRLIDNSNESFTYPVLYYEDALYLEANSRDYKDRLAVLGRNALFLARKLEADDRVLRVYYPGIAGGSQGDANYCAVAKSQDDGSISLSYLLSFVLHPQYDVKVKLLCFKVHAMYCLVISVTSLCFLRHCMIHWPFIKDLR